MELDKLTMNQAFIIDAINEYVSYIEKRSVKYEKKSFLIILDKLALSTNLLPDEEFDNNHYHDLPEKPLKEIKEIICNKFKNFGLYNIPEEIHENIATTKVLVGDAIDDITDIYIDLKRFLWRLEITSYADAFGNLKLNEFHWTEHLRNLQWYVYHLDN